VVNTLTYNESKEFTSFNNSINNPQATPQIFSLFSETNTQQNINNGNVFVPQNQSKSNIFDSYLGSKLKDSNFGENKITAIEPMSNSNAVTNPFNNQTSENTQSKSLLNNNNPFLQKTIVQQNSLFTSKIKIYYFAYKKIN